MIEEKKKYDASQCQIIPGAKCWEKITNEYELTVECGNLDMLIMLDTHQSLCQGKNFRRIFSTTEEHYSLKEFQSTSDLLEAIKNQNNCTVDAQRGVLRLKLPSNKNIHIDIQLEQLDLNQYLRIEFRRLARRQFNVEREIRQENKKRMIDFVEEKNQIKKVEAQNIDIKKQNREQLQTIMEIKDVQKCFKSQAKKIQQQLEKAEKELKGVQQTITKIVRQNRNEHDDILEELRKSYKEQKAIQKMMEGSQEIMRQKLADLMEMKNGQKLFQIGRQQKKERKKKPISIDLTSLDNFQLQHNTLTMKKAIYDEDGEAQQQKVWINAGTWQHISSFQVCINQSKQGDIGIGFGEKATEEDRQNPDYVYAIYYYAGIGLIHYGSGRKNDFISETLHTGDMVSRGMEMLVEVDRTNCTVTFILKGPSKKNGKPIDGTRVYTVQSPHLSRPVPELVPFLVMREKGDSVHVKFG